MDIIAKYLMDGSIFTVIAGSAMTVPDDIGNHERMLIADWEAGGGVISPYESPPVPVPGAMTPLQARRALRAAGLKEAVEGYIATLPEETRETWEYAISIERDHPIILGCAAALNLTGEQIDNLFRLGVTL